MRASIPKPHMMMTSSSNIFEQTEALRKKVLSELGAFDLDLTPVGQTSSVKLLYVMNRSHSALTQDVRQALDGATQGLNYAKTHYALLSIDDLKARLETTHNELSLTQAIELYIEVLDPESLVILEGSILEFWPEGLEFANAPVQGAGRMQKFAYYHMRVVALVSDFFACFDDPELKRLAWAQMLPASHTPIF